MKQWTKKPAARASDKETRVFLKQTTRQGWHVSGGGQRHYRLACPNPCACTSTVSVSSSDAMALRRLRNHLIRYTCWKDPQS